MTTHWRLLASHAAGRSADLAGHLASYGPVPLPAPEAVRAVAAESGIRGRGGAGFPLGRKLAAVAAGAGRAVVVGNACEGEPGSRKDATLCSCAPHLVLDGALLAARAVGAGEIHLAATRGGAAWAGLGAALRERTDAGAVRLHETPPRFVAGEESALVAHLGGGPARPTRTPPRVYERGLRGAPTLVSNVETLAQLALAVRYGAAWYRSAGTADSAGTALVTLGGAVQSAGVVEVAYGTTLRDLVALARPVPGPVQAVLVGGWSGAWLPWPRAEGVAFSHADLAAAGGTVGVGAIEVLAASQCGIARTAAMLRHLADESAAQCGPCMRGLPAVAADLAAAAATRPDPALLARLHRRLGQVAGRGACAHPDGAVRMALSALGVFAADLTAHLQDGRCLAAAPAPAPTPRPPAPEPAGAPAAAPVLEPAGWRP